MSKIDIEFSSDLSQALAFDENKFMRAVETKMGALFDRLQTKIVNRKLGGEVLNRRSGLLAESVSDPEVVTEGTTVTGTLTAAGGDAFYGQVHERGGAGVYSIRVVDKAALRMMIEGKEVFRKMVTHAPLPQRAWFDPSVEEMKNEFVEGLREAVIGGISK